MNKLNISVKGLLVVSICLFGCASKTPQVSGAVEDKPSSPRELCLLKEQNEKKSIYNSLPELLKRVSGNSQLIGESSYGSLPLNPTKKDLARAISLVAQAKDVSSWGTEKEGHANTVSGYVVSPSEWTDLKSKNNIALFRFSVGQPGRPYEIPLTAIRADGDGLVANVDETYIYTPSVGLPSDRKPQSVKVKSQMKIKPIDDRHVLILVHDRSAKGRRFSFTPKYAVLIRTYPQQDFGDGEGWQDWPVYGVGDSVCDGVQ